MPETQIEETDRDIEITGRLDHIDSNLHDLARDVTKILGFIEKWTPMVEKFANPLGGFLAGKRHKGASGG